MGWKYAEGEAKNFNASIGQKRYDYLKTEADRKSLSISDVVQEAIDIRQVVISLFGDDWRDHLAVQVEPIWAKNHLATIMDYLKQLPTLSPQEQVTALEEIEAKISFDGMVG